jgi:hypothetical protein
MSETVEIELLDGKARISGEALEQIKLELMEVLRQKEPAEDYARLLKELEHFAPMTQPKYNVVCIGHWRFKVQNKSALLEYQQMPRAPVMRFYRAPLSFENGRWKVTDVTSYIVHGSGIPY